MTDSSETTNTNNSSSGSTTTTSPNYYVNNNGSTLTAPTETVPGNTPASDTSSGNSATITPVTDAQAQTLLNKLQQSYDDINDAIKQLMGDGGYISGTVGLKAGDSQGVGLHTDKESGKIVYVDKTGIWRTLAETSDISNAAQFLKNIGGENDTSPEAIVYQDGATATSTPTISVIDNKGNYRGLVDQAQFNSVISNLQSNKTDNSTLSQAQQSIVQNTINNSFKSFGVSGDFSGYVNSVVANSPTIQQLRTDDVDNQQTIKQIQTQLNNTTSALGNYLPINLNNDTSLTGVGKLIFNNKGVVFENAPSIVGSISDTPGNTSNTAATTAWVDANYTNKSTFNTFQSSAATTNWVESNYISRDEGTTAGNPVGTIVAYGGPTTPTSYLPCDGSTFDPIAYPDLYKFLGKTTTPDLRGMFLRGLDPTGNVDNYGSTRALLSFEEGSRVVIGDIYNGNGSLFTGVANNQATRAKYGFDTAANLSETFPTMPVSTGSVQFAGTTTGEPMGIARPKNIAVNYIIKARPTAAGVDGDFLPLTLNKDTNVVSNGHELSFDAISVTKTPSDTPGNSSESVPNTQWVDNNYVSKGDIANTGNPVGTIAAWSGVSAPESYLMCDGSSFDPVVYPDLFKVLGKSTTPDLRGMFLRGLDTTNTIDNYDPITPSQRALLSVEEGSYFLNGNGNGTASFAYVFDQNSKSLVGQDLPWATSHAPPLATSPSGQNYNATPQQYNGYGVARPKNVAVNYIIKAKVLSNGRDGDFVPLNLSKDYSITTNGHNLNIDQLHVNGTISDVPGSTSTKVPTTQWVDTNYTSLANFRSLQTTVNNLSSTAATGQYLPVTNNSGTLTANNTNPNAVTGLAFTNYQTYSFDNPVSLTGGAAISGPANFNSAPTITSDPSDTPGNTTSSVPTTSWVDKNYVSNTKLSTLQTSVQTQALQAIASLAIPARLQGSELIAKSADSSGQTGLMFQGYQQYSFDNAVYFNSGFNSNGQVVYSSYVPTITAPITDTPGNTSVKSATTNWVDANYTPKSVTTALQNTVNNLSSSAGSGQYLPLEATSNQTVSGGSGNTLTFGGYGSVSYNSQTTFSAVPTISGTISDTPGKTSTNIPTTSWVDSNYLSKSQGQLLQNIIVGTSINSLGYGTSARPTGYGSLALGFMAQGMGVMSISIGAQNIAQGDRSVSIGMQNTASGVESLALGTRAQAVTDGSTAVGADSGASGAQATALGQSATAHGDHSVALGYNSSAPEANTVSVGLGTANGLPSAPQYRRITNVADAINPHDAVTFEQLNAAISASGSGSNSNSNIVVSGISGTPLIQCFRWYVTVNTANGTPSSFTVPFPKAFSGIPIVAVGNGTLGTPSANLTWDGTNLKPIISNSSFSVNYGFYSTPGSVTDSTGKTVAMPTNVLTFGLDVIAIGPQ